MNVYPKLQKELPETRAAYSVLMPIITRWADNDVYGHVNNATYLSWFDTVLNTYLINVGLLRLHAPDVIGLMVETHCSYFESLAFPQQVHIGLRVAHIGNSSVRYELAAFADTGSSAAKGHLVHVYVDATSRRPIFLSDSWRSALKLIA